MYELSSQYLYNPKTVFITSLLFFNFQIKLNSLNGKCLYYVCYFPLYIRLLARMKLFLLFRHFEERTERNVKNSEK